MTLPVFLLLATYPGPYCLMSEEIFMGFIAEITIVYLSVLCNFRRLQKSRLEQKAKSGAVLYLEKRKNFKELFNSNGRSGCSQTLSDLSKAAIKKSERRFDYNYTIQIFKKKNNST